MRQVLPDKAKPGNTAKNKLKKEKKVFFNLTFEKCVVDYEEYLWKSFDIIGSSARQVQVKSGGGIAFLA